MFTIKDVALTNENVEETPCRRLVTQMSSHYDDVMTTRALL